MRNIVDPAPTPGAIHKHRRGIVVAAMSALSDERNADNLVASIIVGDHGSDRVSESVGSPEKEVGSADRPEIA